MRDSLGGAVNIIIIVVFIVIALGYMAFNVNYTKAFRMKNKIISVYEDYNGSCDDQCRNEIKSYADQIGYKPDTLNCPGGYSKKNGLYCVLKVSINGSQESGIVRDRDLGHYYKIITKINVSIPIIDNTLDLNVFQISGDTKTMYN